MKNDRTEDLHFRVTPDEKERIRERAERAGLSVSDYLRRQALSKKVTVVSSDLFMEYHEMCGDFGRFGNNLNIVETASPGDAVSLISIANEIELLRF